MDKRKGIILAIVLFLLIGLGTYVFAGSSEDRLDGNGTNNSGVKDTTPENDDSDDKQNVADPEDEEPTNPNNGGVITPVGGKGNTATNTNKGGETGGVGNAGSQETNQVTDNSYANALAAVEKAEKNIAQEDVNSAKDLINQVTDEAGKQELEQRIDDVQNIIDVKDLVATLEEKVENSSSLKDVDAARDYNTTNEIAAKVEALANADVKSELSDILTELNKILNDTTSPVVSGINDGEYTNEKLNITIDDANGVMIKLNDKEVSLEDLENLEDDGTYTLVVTDEAFNESTPITFTVDRTNPEFTSLENNTFTNTRVNLTVEDANFDYILIKNVKTGREIKESRYWTSFSLEGTWEVTAYDKAGNASDTYTFTVDTTAPLLIINGETVEATDETLYYNENVTFTVDDENFASFITNGQERNTDNKGWTASGESTYTIVITDKAGNSNTYKIVVDKTAPKINYSNGTIVSEGTIEVTDKNFDYMVIKNVATGEVQTIKEKTFTLPEADADNVRYNITAYDKAGNKSAYTDVYHDNMAPSITGTGKVAGSEVDFENEGYYQSLTLTVSDGSLKKVVINYNGEEKTEEFKNNYTNNKVVYEKEFTEDGTYIVTATDRNGKETVVTFTIDTTTPLLIVNGEVVEATDETLYYNENVTLTVDDENFASFTTNGHERNTDNKGWTASEGSYTIVITDKAGNSNTYKIVVDKTAPTINYNNGTILSEGTIEVTEAYFDHMVIKNYATGEVQTITEKTFTLPDEEADNVRYNITAYDKAGNKSAYTDVYHDNMAPSITGTGKVAQEDTDFENEGYYQSLTLTVSDGSLKKVVIKYNDEETVEEFKNNYTNNKVVYEKEFTEDGTYTVTATDRNGKETVVTFTIDNVAPTRVFSTLDFDGTGKEAIKVDAVDTYYVKNGDSFKFRMRFSEELATAPTVTIGGRTIEVALIPYALNKGEYVYEGTFTIAEDEKELAEGILEILVSNVVDKAGNESTDTLVLNQTETSNHRSVVYDRTAAVYRAMGILPTSHIAKNGTEITVNVQFNEKLAVAPTLKIAGLEEVISFNNGIQRGTEEDPYWVYSAHYTLVENDGIADGRLEFEVYGYADYAGNVGEPLTADSKMIGGQDEIIVDRIAPTGEITMSNNNGLTSTNQDVTVTLKTNETIETPEGWTVVVEGTEFTKVYSENAKNQVVVLKDLAGNETELTYEVKRIDKVAPEVTVVDPNKYQMEVNTEYVEKGYSAWDAVDKDVTNLVKITYQFQAKGTSLWPFVDELDTSKLGTYKVIYTAYDKAGNTAKGTRVVEIVDTTAPVVTANLDANGKKDISLEAGETYQELGATVTDNYDKEYVTTTPAYINHYTLDGKYTGRVSSIDTRKVGKYLVVYQVKDSSGNTSNNQILASKRWVIITDTTAPTVKANLDENGKKDIYVNLGEEYKELGATVTDNADATITNYQPTKYSLYTLSGAFVSAVEGVDTSVEGKYLLVYDYVDESGNSSKTDNGLTPLESKRWVVVQDTTE